MANNESFIRWQGITISQLGFTTNLIFTIALTEMGLIINAIPKSEFELNSVEKWLFSIGFFLLLASFICGIVINLTRLYDYRLTAQIAKKRDDASETQSVSPMRVKTKRLGKWTWGIFWGQILSFAVGNISIVITYLSMYGDKLF